MYGVGEAPQRTRQGWWLGLGVLAGATLASLPVWLWSTEAQVRQAREMSALHEMIKKSEAIRASNEELCGQNILLVQARCRREREDADADASAKRLIEFVDMSDAARPVRQLCECDDRRECRCY